MDFLTLLLLIVISLYLIKNCKANFSSQSVHYIIYGSKRCGYTIKLLDHLKQKNVMKQFIYKEANTSKHYKSLNVEGVPCVYCISTGKVVVGYHTYDQLKKKLY